MGRATVDGRGGRGQPSAVRTPGPDDGRGGRGQPSAVRTPGPDDGRGGRGQPSAVRTPGPDDGRGGRGQPSATVALELPAKGLTELITGSTIKTASKNAANAQAIFFMGNTLLSRRVQRVGFSRRNFR